MKITFPMFGLGWAGGERILANLGNELVNRGHNVNYVVPKRGYLKLYPVEGNIITTPNFWRIPYLEFFHSSLALLPHIPKSDIIFANWCMTAPIVKKAEKQGKGVAAYFVQHMEHLFFPDYFLGYKKYAKDTYKHFDNIIAESRWIRDEIRKISKKESIVINPGIEHELFYPRDVEKDSDTKVILCIAREELWKGNHDLIKALEIVYNKGVNIKLLLIGHLSPDIKTILPYEQMRVNHEDFPKIYSKADVFVQPSWYEGFGLTALEAMACGCPVITTDSGGPSDYALNEINCLVVPPRDIPAMADALLRLLNDETLRKKVIKNGAETVKRFTYKNMADKWEKAMEKFLEK